MMTLAETAAVISGQKPLPDIIADVTAEPAHIKMQRDTPEKNL